MLLGGVRRDITQFVRSVRNRLDEGVPRVVEDIAYTVWQYDNTVFFASPTANVGNIDYVIIKKHNQCKPQWTNLSPSSSVDFHDAKPEVGFVE